MIRNLKVLGLAITAVLALSAVGASMASADAFKSEAAPVTLTGTTDPGTTETFKTTAGSVTCHGSYVGTVNATSTTTLSVTPSYSGCTALGFPGSQVHVNGCSFLFHITPTAGVKTGTVDIVCPEGQSIKVTALSVGTLKCTIDVPAQTGLATVTYSNAGAASGSTREVTVSAVINNLHYLHTSELATGLGKCTAGTGTDGKYEGKALVTGEEDKASGAAHIGIFVA